VTIACALAWSCPSSTSRRAASARLTGTSSTSGSGTALLVLSVPGLSACASASRWAWCAHLKRQAIVDAALEIFLARGFEAGIDLIAQRAGVSKVTIYNHFGSKKELFFAVIHDALTEALGPTTSALEKSLAKERRSGRRHQPSVR
jgi:hypothetical protein